MIKHPILHCGFNADDNNGDEVDGAGTNWPVWPVLFDTFEGLNPLIITDEMLEFFEGCPDVVIEGEHSIATFPEEWRVMIAKPNSWLTALVVPATSNAIVLQAASTSVQILPDKWLETVVIPATRNDLTVSRVVQEQVISPQNNRIVPPANVDTDSRKRA